MKLNTKVNIYLLAILLAMAGLTLLVCTIGINRIVRTLSIELLDSNVRQIVKEIEDAHHILAVAGVVTSPAYVENAQNELIERFKNRSFGFRTGSVLIVKKDNTLVYHADFKPDKSLDEQIFEKVSNEQTHVLRYSYADREWLGVVGKFPQWQWHVALSVTTRELFERRNQIIFWVCLITGAILILTLFIASHYAKKLTQSIETTLQCAKEVERGNLQARVESISPLHEVGLLQQGLNMMITEREKTEQALRKERDRAQKYLDIANVIFVALNTQGEVTLINQKGCKVLGFSEEEIRGKNWFDNFIPESRRQLTKEAFRRYMGDSTMVTELAEAKVIVRSGAERSIFWNNSILRDSRGKIIGILSSGEDITERKRTEEEKEKLQIQLQHAYKMEAIGRLTGGIAHDFNNIIGIILGNTELTMDTISADHPAHMNLHEVLTACQRAEEVVRQLLNFSRKTETEFRVTNIAKAVQESVRLMRATIPTSIGIEVDIENRESFVYADSTQIHQLIINLFTNAVHAIGDDIGSISVTLGERVITDTQQWYFSAAPGDYVELQVRDTGIGISPDYIDRVFDPYFTTKDIGKGSGMGLSVVHGVVSMHGGAIHVESNLGEGTTFYILFPKVAFHMNCSAVHTYHTMHY